MAAEEQSRLILFLTVSSGEHASSSSLNQHVRKTGMLGYNTEHFSFRILNMYVPTHVLYVIVHCMLCIRKMFKKK